jgi:hypothetical protein
MKKNLFSLLVVHILILSFNQFVLSQNPIVSSISSVDKTENISADELRRLQKGGFRNPGETENPDNPALTQINFDDIRHYWK